MLIHTAKLKRVRPKSSPEELRSLYEASRRKNVTGKNAIKTLFFNLLNLARQRAYHHWRSYRPWRQEVFRSGRSLAAFGARSPCFGIDFGFTRRTKGVVLLMKASLKPPKKLHQY